MAQIFLDPLLAHVVDDVLIRPEAGVAWMAEKSPDAAGLVAVVNGENAHTPLAWLALST